MTFFTIYLPYLDEKGEFSVLVLTTGSWPISAATQLEYQLPREIESSLDSFQKFYQKQHSGRKLTWLNHLAKCDVKLSGFDKRYELQVSMCQFSVMNMFNDRDSLTVKEILGISRLSLSDFRKHFKALLDLNLFKCSAGGESAISELETISIDAAFTNKRTKIKVPQITQTESPKEREVTHKAVDDDRKLYLQVRADGFLL